MESTWKLLDEWQAPEPSAFFDAKLYARLRVEQTTIPWASFFERAKAWLLYSSNLQMRPLAAGALATVLVIGGGTFARSTTRQRRRRRPRPRCAICSRLTATPRCFSS